MTAVPSEPDGLRRAVETMRAIRDRCVWTQGMTHRALVPYLIEESAELVDAVETGSRTELREELGDVLWQVLFHAEIAARDDDEPFDINDVASDLADKMVHRHPHVFGDAVATTPDEVLVVWNAAKAAEKRERRSVLDGIPRDMASLARAQKVLGRAERVGIRSAESSGEAEPPSEAEPSSEAELGEHLLRLVASARARGWDAERALRERIRGVEDEIRAAEAERGGVEAEGSTSK